VKGAVASSVTYAQGALLDILVTNYALTRGPGETDEDLRARALGLEEVVRTVEEEE